MKIDHSRLDQESPGRAGLRDPSAYFDADFYVSTHQDVARAGVDPLGHYLEHGWREGRNPNPWFSTANYIRMHPELLVTGEDPLSHLSRRKSDEIKKAPERARHKNFSDLPLLSSIIHIQPNFPTKWLSESYLAKGLGQVQRACIHLNTYALLARVFAAGDLKDILFNGMNVWSTETPECSVEITFRMSQVDLNEGELELVMKANDHKLYTFSFSIAPNEILPNCPGDKLFVSRMQMAPNTMEATKSVTKALADVTPQSALFAAAQGIARVLRISTFIGVPAHRQSSLSAEVAIRRRSVYDRFFETLGATQGPGGLFFGELEPPQLPLSSIKAGHKIRTRKKRMLKAQIRDAAAAALGAASVEGQGMA